VRSATVRFLHSDWGCARPPGIPSSSLVVRRQLSIPSFRPEARRAALGFLHPHQGAIGHWEFRHSAWGRDRQQGIPSSRLLMLRATGDSLIHIKMRSPTGDSFIQTRGAPGNRGFPHPGQGCDG
jgi:hypothetical protein